MKIPFKRPAMEAESRIRSLQGAERRLGEARVQSIGAQYSAIGAVTEETAKIFGSLGVVKARREETEDNVIKQTNLSRSGVAVYNLDKDPETKARVQADPDYYMREFDAIQKTAFKDLERIHDPKRRQRAEENLTINFSKWRMEGMANDEGLKVSIGKDETAAAITELMAVGDVNGAQATLTEGNDYFDEEEKVAYAEQFRMGRIDNAAEEINQKGRDIYMDDGIKAGQAYYEEVLKDETLDDETRDSALNKLSGTNNQFVIAENNEMQRQSAKAIQTEQYHIELAQTGEFTQDMNDKALADGLYGADPVSATNHWRQVRRAINKRAESTEIYTNYQEAVDNKQLVLNSADARKGLNLVAERQMEALGIENPFSPEGIDVLTNIANSTGLAPQMLFDFFAGTEKQELSPQHLDLMEAMEEVAEPYFIEVAGERIQIPGRVVEYGITKQAEAAYDLWQYTGDKSMAIQTAFDQLVPKTEAQKNVIAADYERINVNGKISAHLSQFEPGFFERIPEAAGLAAFGQTTAAIGKVWSSDGLYANQLRAEATEVFQAMYEYTQDERISTRAMNRYMTNNWQMSNQTGTWEMTKEPIVHDATNLHSFIANSIKGHGFRIRSADGTPVTVGELDPAHIGMVKVDEGENGDKTYLLTYRGQYFSMDDGGSPKVTLNFLEVANITKNEKERLDYTRRIDTAQKEIERIQTIQERQSTQANISTAKKSQIDARNALDLQDRERIITENTERLNALPTLPIPVVTPNSNISNRHGDL